MYDTYGSVEKIYYMFIAVIGVPVNLLAIVILSRGKCGLSTCTTRYLVAMAAADLLVIVTEVILRKFNAYYFPLNFLSIYPVCSVIYVLTRSFMDCFVWFTVAFTFDRFVAICCQKLKTKYCTGKTATVVLATTGVLQCLRNVPMFFVTQPGEIIDNVGWFCALIPTFYANPGWVGYTWFVIVLTPFLPFAIILLVNALTVRHILVASRVRKGLRAERKGENGSDPEMESRRRSMILLFTLSANFILLWLAYIINHLYYNIAGTNPNNYTGSLKIFLQVAYMLMHLSCCTNTFIYGVTQSKFREQVQKMVKYPISSIIQLIKNQNS